jgi:hypothetical protein
MQDRCLTFFLLSQGQILFARNQACTASYPGQGRI